MPLDLSGQITSPPSAEQQAMLDTLQPNILKGHTRDFLSIFFLKFTDAAEGRGFLSKLEPLMKSASKHLAEIDAFKKSKVPGTPYVGVGLTAAGYAKLEVTDVPVDQAFRNGMQGNPKLNDPPVDKWDEAFRAKADLHACVLIGDMTMEPKSATHDKVSALLNATPSVVVLGTQDGTGLHNSNGDGIEHFGYVDGRSQPLFLASDIENEMHSTDGTSIWNPAFAIGRAIVPEPAPEGAGEHFGSYFIFRKLEQDVQAFKIAELKFAKDLGLEVPERAGALLVGRFEDGTPVTSQAAEGAHSPVLNNFDYSSDAVAGKCPFLGHIRKTNPRGTGGFEDHDKERMHIMARRGQTYGVRVDNPNDGATANKPTGNVGLLFMAFNSDIGDQFEFTQIAWANGAGFPRVPPGTPAPGVDALIGQTAGDVTRPKMSVPSKWGDAASMQTVDAVPRTVTMKGGEYFFMPSLSFMRRVGQAGVSPAPAKTA